MQRLRRTVEKNDTLLGRVFDSVIQCLIVVSLVSFSIETLPDLSAASQSLLNRIETVTSLVFTVEYGLRWWVAKRKMRFVFSFFGLVDLLAILPFYLSSGVDLRAVRLFRLLRIFRTFKLFRYSAAIDRFGRAFLLVREELVLFFSLTLLIFFMSGVGIYYFEHEAQPEVFASIFHSLWWAVATLTTVGYGDVYPVTIGGKVFTFFILMVGLGIVAIPSGLVASALSESRQTEAMETVAMQTDAMQTEEKGTHHPPRP